MIDIFIVKQRSDYLWTTDNQFAYKKDHSMKCVFYVIKRVYTLLL